MIGRRTLSKLATAQVLSLVAWRQGAAQPPLKVLTIESDPDWQQAALEANGEFRNRNIMATSLPLNRIPGYVDWVKQPVGSRLQVRWETNDKKSPDYGHLAQPTATADFVVNAKVLEAYRDLNSFKLWSGQPLVLFGLRGAILSKPSTDFASELVVKEAYPDHENFKCVIGIWDTRNGMVRGFRASTVPNVEYMARQVFKYRCFADQNASCYAPGEPMTLDNEANLRRHQPAEPDRQPADQRGRWRSGRLRHHHPVAPGNEQCQPRRPQRWHAQWRQLDRSQCLSRLVGVLCPTELRRSMLHRGRLEQKNGVRR